MIFHDRTSGFEPGMVLDVLPKIMTTLVVDFCSDASTASMKALKGFCAVHRLLLRFTEEFPQLREMATNKIQKFISNEQFRHKDVVPSLGMQWMLLMH